MYLGSGISVGALRKATESSKAARRLYKYPCKVAILDGDGLVGSLVGGYFVRGYSGAKYFDEVKKYLPLTKVRGPVLKCWQQSLMTGLPISR